MRTVPAQEINRHGLSYIDAVLQEGPVHVVKNKKLKYVILTEKYYRAFRKTEDSYLARIQKSLHDLKHKKIIRGSAKKLIKLLGVDK